MTKGLLRLALFLASVNGFAAQSLDLYQAPLSSLSRFPSLQKAKKSSHLSHDAVQLQEVSQTIHHSRIISRYQQFYQGIPVVGAQVTITQDKTLKTLAQDQGLVSGHLLEGINLNAQPVFNKQQALEVTRKAWLTANPQVPIQQEKAELQIRVQPDDSLKLVYQVSFRSMENNKPAWPFFIVDAQSGKISQQWNNIKNFLDSGPGGNEKVHKYWYGKDNLPALDVAQQGSVCTMNNAKVKLVNLKFAWDWEGVITTAYQYACNNNQEEYINGAFSPINDAYYFGHVIVDMYQEWYGLPALQNPDGSAAQLVMRVHFGDAYDNAFWDGQSMSFGDGANFYPLVSLDVAGHEVTHGFTEQHANLEYHDQSGALNESLSDMGGQAARAYLLEKFPQLYNKVYLEPNQITWGIGETIVRDSFSRALRFMDSPSEDGMSADCMDKKLAESVGAQCAISYTDVITFASQFIPGIQNQQSFIVHTASGVFNKAFYLLSKEIGIKKAYQVMVIANMKYWTPTTNFTQGACGVLYGARDLSVNTAMVKTIFAQVGVNTGSCGIN